MLQYFLASLLTSAAGVVDGSFVHWRYREYPTCVPLPANLSHWETRICKNATSLSSFSGEIWKLIPHDSSEIPVWNCTAIIHNKNPLSNTFFFIVFFFSLLPASFSIVSLLPKLVNKLFVLKYCPQLLLLRELVQNRED